MRPQVELGPVRLFVGTPCNIRHSLEPTHCISKATSAADGTVDVWDVTQEVPRRVHTLEDIIPAVKDTKCVNSKKPGRGQTRVR